MISACFTAFLFERGANVSWILGVERVAVAGVIAGTSTLASMISACFTAFLFERGANVCRILGIERVAVVVVIAAEAAAALARIARVVQADAVAFFIGPGLGGKAVFPAGLRTIRRALVQFVDEPVTDRGTEGK